MPLMIRTGPAVLWCIAVLPVAACAGTSSRARQALRQADARGAAAAGVPHRELRALLLADRRGRLSKALRQRLVALLRLRAAEWERFGAPGLAAADWRQARAAVPGAVRLALADRLLRSGKMAQALRRYGRLARQGVLSDAAARWRLAAAGLRPAKKESLARAVRELWRQAPDVARRTVVDYLRARGRRPATLIQGLRAAVGAPSGQLAQRLDGLLARQGRACLLAEVCAIRQRPGSSPSCRKLRRLAASQLEALRVWAAVCRRYQWSPGDATWLIKVSGLLGKQGVLGLGPLEGLISRDAALKAAARLQGASQLGLLRIAGQTDRVRTVLKTLTGRSIRSHLRLAHEAWAAGLKDLSRRQLHQARVKLLGAEKESLAAARPAPLFRLIQLTERVVSKAEAWRLAARLRNEPRLVKLRQQVAEWYLLRGALPAALFLRARARSGQVLERFGRILARWQLVGKTGALRRRWQRRYGRKPVLRAWRLVDRGARTRETVALREAQVLLGRGRLKATQAALERLPWSVRRERLRARVLILRGRRRAAGRVLLRLRDTTPGGVRHLRVVLRDLAELGLHAAARRVADELYELQPADPVLLGLLAATYVAIGQVGKAHLLTQDWAARSTTPDRVYLRVARTWARRGNHRLAARWAYKALEWTGGRCLDIGLRVVAYLARERRRSRARQVADWLIRQQAAVDRPALSRAVTRILAGSGARPSGLAARVRRLAQKGRVDAVSLALALAVAPGDLARPAALLAWRLGRRDVAADLLAGSLGSPGLRSLSREWSLLRRLAQKRPVPEQGTSLETERAPLPPCRRSP